MQIMINDTESSDIEKKTNVDFYKDMLKSHILGSNPLLQMPKSDMERYIAVFSLYLQHSNEAYKYNLPYLSHQHNGYATFLISAPKKAEKLLEIIKNIKKSDVIRMIIDNNATIKEELTVSLNEFLAADLSGNIDFHRCFSLPGAIRRNEDDIISIEYKKQVRVVRLTSSTKTYLEKITLVVEKFLSSTLDDGGEK